MGFDFLRIRNPITDEQEMSFVNGDWETITGAEECLQRIETRLKRVLGEYAFDLKDGLPLFDQIFRKSQSQDLIRNYYRAEILKTRGVRAVTELILTPSSDRKFKINFTAIYEDDTIINGEV